jgi:benzoyl-CoA reductase/2-hydroxyglutaryl-CoA dehydratase subunit BcrC/BadD/HgdB
MDCHQKIIDNIRKLDVSTLLKKIEDFQTEEHQNLLKFKEAGGKVAATFCRFFPPSLLWGLGIWPLRILSGATVEAESNAEKLVRPDACSYCKSIIGNFLQQSSLHSQVDLVVGIISCDQMRRTLERLQNDLKIPVIPVQLPATATEDSENYFVISVKRAVEDLSDYLDIKVSMEKVREYEDYRNKISDIISTMMLKFNLLPHILQKLSWTYHTSRPKQFYNFLKSNMENIPDFKPATKVLLTGSVNSEEEIWLFEVLTKHQIGVIPVNCSGLHSVQDVCDLENIPDQEIVKSLALSTFRSAPCIRRRPNNQVYDQISETVRKTSAAGIILKTLPFCDLWYSEKERMKQTFEVPVLVLDTGFGEGVKNKNTGRIEAFVESLQ